MKKICCKENIKENKDIIPEFSSGSSTHVVSKQPQQASKTLKQVQGLSNRNITGFTLIELLVVVLIIGILAAIALPQYQKAVEKSRVAEVLQNAKVIEECFDWYILEHGLPSNGTVDLADMDCPMEINLGNLDEEDGGYKTENFWYEYVNCSRALGCMADIRRFPNNLYSFEVMVNPSSRRKKSKVCFTQFTDRGHSVCNGLRNQGWEYEEGEL